MTWWASIIGSSVSPATAESPEYAQFWQKLGRGEYDAGEFKRISKDGADVWLQASYNPIIDIEGKTYSRW